MMMMSVTHVHDENEEELVMFVVLSASDGCFLLS